MIKLGKHLSDNVFTLFFISEQRKRKIIPCLYRPCDNLPTDLRMYFLLDYERSKKLKLCFWDLLYKSVATASPQPATSQIKLAVKSR